MQLANIKRLIGQYSVSNLKYRIGNLFPVITALATTVANAAPSFPINPTGLKSFTNPTGSNVVAVKVAQDPECIALQLQIGKLDRIDQAGEVLWDISGECRAALDGAPDLPAISRFIRIPDRGHIEIRERNTIQRRISGNPPTQYRADADGETNTKIQTNIMDDTDIWPPAAVQLSRPLIARGVRFVQLMLYPVRWDAGRREYIVQDNFDIELVNTGGIGENEIRFPFRSQSRDFNRAIEALLVNPPQRDDDDEYYYPGGYLVVANDGYPEEVDEFCALKRRAGHPVRILTFDPGAMNRVQLKEQIQAIYNEALQDGREPFEYLLFIGSDDAEPPLAIPLDDLNRNFHEIYDNFFGQLEGDDVIPDVAVGAFNCVTVDNLICALQRSISYQYTPYTENPEWFVRACICVGHCSVANWNGVEAAGDLSPSYAGKWVAEVLRRSGFDEIIQTYYADNGNNDFSPLVANMYNRYTNLILVRAHQHDINNAIGNIRNREVFPFHFLVSSSTIEPGRGGNWRGAWNQLFRMGTPQDMRGPSAGFGHYPSPRTNCANALVGGLADALFFRDIRSFGWARWWMCVNLPRLFPAEAGQQIINRYWGTLRYYGDPGQMAWLAQARPVQVNQERFISQNFLAVNVNADNEPVAGALVALSQAEGLQIVKFSDISGRAAFTWRPRDLNQNPLEVFVGGDNIAPVSFEPEFVAGFSFYDILAYTIFETTGNGDESLNPGETIGINLTALSDEMPPRAHQAVCSPLSPWLEGEFDIVAVPAVEQFQQFQLQIRGNVRIRPGCPDNERLDFSLLSDRQDYGFQAGLTAFVNAPNILVASGPEFDEAVPGGETGFRLSLINRGPVDARAIITRLESLTPYCAIRDGLQRLNRLNQGEQSDEITVGTLLFAGNALRGSPVSLRLIITGNPGVQDTLLFAFNLTEARNGDPVGPDNYGYIALDDTDRDLQWAAAPDFRWFNINSIDGDVQGQRLPFPAAGERDSSVVVELPFAFRYYGQEFRQITVCNNGWLAIGDQHLLKNQQNWPMPGMNGAYGMLAPFWDRLEMNNALDGVFVYYDQMPGRYYVQWQTGAREDGDWQPNAFQVILHDPQRWPTRTGDSQIIFQYNTVNDVQDQWEANAHCTVGISSPDGKDGLTYTYWNRYAAGAARLQAGRAILWTTCRWEGNAWLWGRVTRYIDSTAVEGAQVGGTLTNREGNYRLPISTVAEGGDMDLLIFVSKERYLGIERVLNIQGPVLEDDSVEANFILPHGWLALPDSALTPARNLGNRPCRVIIELLYLDTTSTNFLIIEPSEFELDPNDVLNLIINIDATGLPVGDHRVDILYNTDDPQVRLVRTYILHIDEIINPSEFPIHFHFAEPYPNPFNSTVNLQFALPKAENVQVVISDISGREVNCYHSNGLPAGWHTIALNSNRLPAGVYFIRFAAGNFKALKKVVLIK
ncbi:MAG: T9SS type A sorting domain-containing protein [Calditrichaeota bacterium]|nr:T9SS type A sorting domain-containing protein [Calditrichota bacterium]